jgi:hypothetical protein
MTAAAPTRSPFAEARVCLIGSAFTEPVLGLLAYSRWQVEQIPDIDAAARLIEAGSLPVLFCGEGEWRKVVEATRGSLHPPAVIVLTDAPKDSVWAEVLKAGAHYIDVRNLDGPELFSLLNLLWRAWHGD